MKRVTGSRVKCHRQQASIEPGNAIYRTVKQLPSDLGKIIFYRCGLFCLIRCSKYEMDLRDQPLGCQKEYVRLVMAAMMGPPWWQPMLGSPYFSLSSRFRVQQTYLLRTQNFRGSPSIIKWIRYIYMGIYIGTLGLLYNCWLEIWARSQTTCS